MDHPLPPTRRGPAPHIELRENFGPRPEIRHVLFDFDGTLSLIREGWPEVMLPMFVEMLPPQPREDEATVRQMLLDDIMRLNGKQTIYQMIQFAERVRERGGQPRDPLWYKQEYLRRLEARIHERIDGLSAGRLKPDDWLVYGARPLLERLCARGLKLYLASGTDEPFVWREARLLQLEPYFEGRIFGALDNYQDFSKKKVIDRILAENHISGRHLLAFGDGYVEIQNTHEVGGLTVAVASDEAHNGSGRVDQWKRQRLLAVGADMVIPDYRKPDLLLEILFGPRYF